jgi:hypothetical protein
MCTHTHMHTLSTLTWCGVRTGDLVIARYNFTVYIYIFIKYIFTDISYVTSMYKFIYPRTGDLVIALGANTADARFHVF